MKTKAKLPNQVPEPTSGSVTPRADARVAPPPPVAHRQRSAYKNMRHLLTALLIVAPLTCMAGFDVVLMDDPAVKVTFDRKYEVMQISKKEGRSPSDPLLYMMLPEDQQSAVTLGIGDGLHLKTEEDIAQMCEGAKVTKVDCSIGGVKGEWWHYRDSRHLYSTCVIKAPRPKKPPLTVVIELVANTPERLASLEESFSKLILVENPPNQPPQRNAGSRPSSGDSPASETPSSLGPRG